MVLRWLLASLLAGWCAPVVRADFPTPLNITEISARYPLDEAARATLRERGFVVLGDHTVRGLHQAYPSEPQDLYVFVTTDAMLQLWHDLYLEVLQSAELRGLAPSLRQAVAALARECARQYGRSDSPAARKALADAAILLCVADRLLGGNTTVPAGLAQRVDALLTKVREHRSFEAYPGDDYTQYTVRGHYVSTEDLSRYFVGSMWLSRRILSVRPERKLPDPHAPLRCAVALAHLLRSCPGARQRLASVNAVRAAIAGPANAISVEQCLGALNEVLGSRWTLEGALSADSLRRLRAELAKPAYPAARVHTGGAYPGEFPDRIIALVPDHAVPDSILFQNTVNDAIGGRSLPSGLDVAAALDHKVAAEELRRTDPHAAEVLRAVAKHRSLLRDDGGTIYRGWTGALCTLAATDPRSPDFMRNRTWAYEKMNTCLASWSQLRHVSILYAAQAYAALGLSLATPMGWVEPYPAFYRAMADLAERTSRIMRRVGGVDSEHEQMLRAYAGKCREFARYAEAELSGRWTVEQGHAIRGFGSWLNNFPFRSRPVIADVATGSDGEVLHAGVGDMNPIIVVPDRKSAVAYVGFVMSYYEITRLGTERLTDASWQALLDTPNLRPERPPWAAQFVYVDRGPRWQALSPLRQAEELFLAGKADDAIARLRSAIERDPDGEVATELRYRLGEHYRRERQFDAAEAEWTVCLQMHGGEAWDRALQGLIDLPLERLQEQDWMRERREGAKKLTDILQKLSGSQSGAERAALEREAARLALSGCVRSWYAEDAPTLAEVLRACREPDVREALTWYDLQLRGEGFEYGLGQLGLTAYLSDCRHYLRTAKSPALRAAVYMQAIRLGYLKERPMEAARILAWCATQGLARDDTSDAFALVRQATKGEKPRVADDRFRPGDAAHAGSRLAEQLWYQGRIHDARRVLEIIPRGTGSGPWDELMTLYAAFPDFDRKPLSMYARAGGPGHARDCEALLAIYRKYPNAAITPLALAEAERLLGSRAADRQKASEVRRLVRSRYPNSPVAILYCTDAALEQDRLDEAERLYRELSRQRDSSRTVAAIIAKRLGSNHAYRLDEVRKLKEILEPVLLPAGRGDLLRASVLLDMGYRPYELLPKRAPGLAANIRLAFLRHKDYGFVAADFLREYPDHPAAGEAWEVLERTWVAVERDNPVGNLAWLADLINRVPPYRYRAEAEAVLERYLTTFPEAAELAGLREARARWTGTRAGMIAAIVEARTLLIRHRPEEALTVLAAVAPSEAVAGGLASRIQFLRVCAEQTIKAKRAGPWTPVRTMAEPKPQYEALHSDDRQPAPGDDLSVLLRRRYLQQPRSAAYRGVRYCVWDDGILYALDQSTGACLGIAVPPHSPALRIVANEEGVRLTDYEGKVVVYPLRR